MAVGDTAGHVLPALAIANAYCDVFSDVEVAFFAGEGDWASRLVPASGHALHIVPATPFMTVGAVDRLTSVASTLPTLLDARRVMRRLGVRLVIGTGGYASGGVLLAARSLGLRTAILEPNAVPGLANRLLGRLVHRAYVMFDETRIVSGAGRALRTGLPLNPSHAMLRRVRTPPSPNGAVHVFVTGGSRGDEFLASNVPALVESLQASGVPVVVRHQVTLLDPQTVQRRYAQGRIDAETVAFLDDIAQSYDWAHFVIGRAGAGTLAELALAGLPSLLVPLADAASDHQAANAAAFAGRGAALWVRERDWDTRTVADQIAAVVCAPARWAAMSNAARAFAQPDASVRIVRDCEDLMQSRW